MIASADSDVRRREGAIKPFVTALNDRLVTGQVFPGPYCTAESGREVKAN